MKKHELIKLIKECVLEVISEKRELHEGTMAMSAWGPKGKFSGSSNTTFGEFLKTLRKWKSARDIKKFNYDSKIFVAHAIFKDGMERRASYTPHHGENTQEKL